MIPDSHAHLDLIDLDPREVVSHARSGGVSPVITIGITLESSRIAAALAESLEGVYASVGVHPNDSSSAGDADLAGLEEIAHSSRRVVAVGETGLDYYRDRVPAVVQKESFRRHIELARRLGKALIVHDREAHADVLDILAGEETGDIPVVMHCFSGDEAVLAECIRRGYYMSFAGPVTFRKADAARRAAAAAPLDRLLAETDSPFLSPEPFRGKPNLPERVRLVAEELARVRSLEMEEMERILTENTRRAFGLDGRGVGL